MSLRPKDCEELGRLATGPGTGVGYQALARYLKRAGWECRGSKGSHRVWRRKGLGRIVLVDRNPVLPVYVWEVARRLRKEHCA